VRFLNALEQAHWHIRTLWRVIIVALVINIVVIVGWIHSPTRLKIMVPPHIPQSGLTLTVGDIPKTTVYSFAYYIWQRLNHWASNGLLDYQQQITTLSPFLTPTFKAALVQNYNHLLNEGELQDRIRFMQGLTSDHYSPIAVKSMGHNTWWVHLTMRLTEMMNANAKVVKDVVLSYTLKVVRYDVDAHSNPWGLALAGFVKSPMRIKTNI